MYRWMREGSLSAWVCDLPPKDNSQWDSEENIAPLNLHGGWKVQRNSICWSLQSLRCSMHISRCLYTRQSGKCRQCNVVNLNVNLLLPPWDARLWRVGCFTHHQPTDILARPIVRVRDLQDCAIFSKAQQQSKGSRPLWQKCDHPRVVLGFCLHSCKLT